MIKTASLDQLVRTIDGHPLPFEGTVIGMILVVRDQEGVIREVDSRWATELEPHP